MKKRILSLALICAMLVSVIAALPVSADVVHQKPWNTSSSTKINALYGTPDVDGVIGDDEGWNEAEYIPLEYVMRRNGWGAHPEADPAVECDVKYRAMWDEELVYFLIEIKDDELTPDFFTPNPVDHTDSQWYRNDCLFLFVSENGNATGKNSGNSYQLALPLTEEYYESAILRRGTNNNADLHPIGDNALTRKTTVDGGNVVIELSLKRRAELVGDTNFVGMSMGLGINYYDVDGSSPEAQAAKDSNFASDPRTMTVSSYEGAECGTSDDNMENSKGANNLAGIKFTRKYDVLKGTPVVDGVIDGIWTDAAKGELKNVVTINGTGNESVYPDRTDSCSVYAKNLYDDGKIYMLIVIEDNDLCTGITDKEWKNDSITVKLGEQQYWYSEHNGVQNNTAITYATQNTYEFYVHPAGEEAAFNGVYVRSNCGNTDNIEFDYEYTVEGNDDDGYTIVMELGITLKNFTNESGKAYYVDYQYNDADPTPDQTMIDKGNNRDLVINWTTGDLGLNNGNVLSKMVLSENEATDPDAAVEIEPSLVGDYYVSDMDGNVLYLLNFNNGALTVVDKTEEDGADYSGEYTYNGTFDTGIKVYDASGAETGISITNMRGRYFFNTTPMGMGNLMSAGQPPVKPVMKLGDNAYNITITNGWAEGVEVSFTAEKAGKYTLSAASNEDNAEVSVIADYSSEMVDLPYEFVLDEGETVKFYISSTALLQSEDEINLVLSLEGENAETGDLGVMIAVVALVAVLGMGITAVTSKRVSVR